MVLHPIHYSFRKTSQFQDVHILRNFPQCTHFIQLWRFLFQFFSLDIFLMNPRSYYLAPGKLSGVALVYRSTENFKLPLGTTGNYLRVYHSPHQGMHMERRSSLGAQICRKRLVKLPKSPCAIVGVSQSHQQAEYRCFSNLSHRSNVYQ